MTSDINNPLVSHPTSQEMEKDTPTTKKHDTNLGVDVAMIGTEKTGAVDTGACASAGAVGIGSDSATLPAALCGSRVDDAVGI